MNDPEQQRLAEKEEINRKNMERILEGYYLGQIDALANLTNQTREQVQYAIDNVCNQTRQSKYVIVDTLLMFHRTIANT